DCASWCPPFAHGTTRRATCTVPMERRVGLVYTSSVKRQKSKIYENLPILTSVRVGFAVRAASGLRGASVENPTHERIASRFPDNWSLKLRRRTVGAGESLRLNGIGLDLLAEKCRPRSVTEASRARSTEGESTRDWDAPARRPRDLDLGRLRQQTRQERQPGPAADQDQSADRPVRVRFPKDAETPRHFGGQIGQDLPHRPKDPA